MSAAQSLDPPNWPAARAEAHRMLDDILDHMAGLCDQPVWREPPQDLREAFREPLPQAGAELAELRQVFGERIAPYSSGNAHPGFMGWVQGGGALAGVLGEMLAAGLNSNLGGRDHMPLEVEQQVLAWVREMFGFPQDASGLFVTGTSQANFLAVLVARTRAFGRAVRGLGLAAQTAPLTAYASRAAHGCIAKAMDMAGIGSDQLRLVATDEEHRIDVQALATAIAEDRRKGFRPFLVVGAAGTVDIGAIDDLAALAELAAAEGLHFHVDGAFGALGVLAPSVAPRLKGLERADSVAFDWHKWGQVPYDAGFLLVRDRRLHLEAFAAEAPYLTRASSGLAGGDFWPCDYGPDLSRGFRALKTWFTVKAYGAEALGAVIERTCALARELQARVAAEPELELLAPVPLNIVCFRHRGADPDRLNGRIVEVLHAQGRAAPSLTRVDGLVAIRAAFVNHRTQSCDVEALVSSVLAAGRDLIQRKAA